MLYSDSNGSRENFAKDPAVVRFGDTYFLYYSVYEADGDRFVIGIAKSSDMESWEYCGTVTSTQECEKNGIAAPGAYIENGTVHLFYQTYGNKRLDAICHAVSSDGINFTKDETNPIFRPTDDWCCGRAIDADVIAHDGKLFLYFATRDHAMKIQKQGAAFAPLGSDYSRGTWTQAHCGSVLTPEFIWEGECIEAAATLTHNGKIYMFYGGSYNCTPQQIGCAVSDDGVFFKKLFTSPFIENGKDGDWNASESGHPYAFTDTDGKHYLFYQGSPDGGKSWYLSRCRIEFDGDTPYVAEYFNKK